MTHLRQQAYLVKGVRVSVVDAPSTALGESCKQALLAASPFPAMAEDVRCLAGRKLSGTFTIPVEGAP